MIEEASAADLMNEDAVIGVVNDSTPASSLSDGEAHAAMIQSAIEADSSELKKQ